jgi:hypothetical protein
LASPFLLTRDEYYTPQKQFLFPQA